MKRDCIIRWSAPLWVILAWGLLPTPTEADSVDIVIPASVSFSVTNPNAATAGSPNPFTITYTDLVKRPSKLFRISVMAESVNFTPVNGTAISANKASWTTSNAANGTGYSGTLSPSTYTLVYASNSGSVTSGSVSLNWTLAAIPGTRAGTYTVNLRWRLEAP